MSWLSVIAQSLAVGIAIGVLAACSVEVGRLPAGDGWYSKFTTSLPEQDPALLQPATPLPLSPSGSLQRNRAKGNSDANGNVASRDFPPN